MIPRCLLIQAIWILWKNSWITLLRYTIFWNWNNIICINLHFLIASFDYRKIPTGFLDDLLLIVFYVLNPIYSYLWKYRNKIRFPLTVRLISWYIYRFNHYGDFIRNKNANQLDEVNRQIQPTNKTAQDCLVLYRF